MFPPPTLCRLAAPKIRPLPHLPRRTIVTDISAQRAQRHPRSPKARLNRSPLLSLLSVTFAVSFCLGANYYLLPLLSPPPPSLSSQKFTKCTIIEKLPVSSTASIYTLRLPGRGVGEACSGFWGKGMWSLEFKQPALQIARRYTPLPPRGGEGGDEGEGELRFLIRRLKGGEMSNYLSRLDVGEEVEVRGPGMEYEMKERDREGNTDVLFVAGGTGVSSALQAVHCFLGKSSADAAAGGGDRITILWANRRREDCLGAPMPPKPLSLISSLFARQTAASQSAPLEPCNAIVAAIQQLQAQYPNRVSVSYFVDEEGSFITPRAIQEAMGKMGCEGEGRRKLLMASGPEGFMEYFVGGKGDWEGAGQAQGRIGGVVKALGLRGWEVVKL